MKEPELDQFMSPAKFYIHKDGPFPRRVRKEGPSEQGYGERYCLKLEDGSVTFLDESGENVQDFTDMDFFKESVKEGIWVQTENPFKTDHDTL